jgi:hypothetical protein
MMKLSRALMLASIAFIAPATSHAQVAGSTLLGVSYGELRDVTFGWSAMRQILGQPVFNDNDERVGFVQDVLAETRPLHTPSSMPVVLPD